jgi:hypothetical protein
LFTSEGGMPSAQLMPGWVALLAAVGDQFWIAMFGA